MEEQISQAGHGFSRAAKFAARRTALAAEVRLLKSDLCSQGTEKNVPQGLNRLRKKSAPDGKSVPQGLNRLRKNSGPRCSPGL